MEFLGLPMVVWIVIIVAALFAGWWFFMREPIEGAQPAPTTYFTS